MFLYPRVNRSTSILSKSLLTQPLSLIARRLSLSLSPYSIQADTPGCTTQACGFRDYFSEISELGYDVYGLSKDKPAAQQKVSLPSHFSLSLFPC